MNERVVCVLSKNKKERMNNNRIKEIRLSQHKTQKDLAKLLGVSEQAIAYYEKALREPPLKTWIKLANFFHVSVSYLQGVTDYNNTGGWINSYDDDAVQIFSNALGDFQKTFTNNKQNDLTDHEKMRMVNILLSLKNFLNKSIPQKTDEFNLSHKKHEIINKIGELVTFLDKNDFIFDDTKELQFSQAVKIDKTLTKLLNVVNKESVSDHEKD